jgi:hypothetical protein
MEKTKKWFIMSLIIYLIGPPIIILLSFVISKMIPAYTAPVVSSILGSIIMLILILTLFIPIIFAFYFFLVLKEIKKLKVFLTWLIANILNVAYYDLFVFILSLIAVRVQGSAEGFEILLFGLLFLAVIVAIITGIVAIIVYFKNRKKQVQKNANY